MCVKGANGELSTQQCMQCCFGGRMQVHPGRSCGVIKGSYLDLAEPSVHILTPLHPKAEVVCSWQCLAHKLLLEQCQAGCTITNVGLNGLPQGGTFATLQQLDMPQPCKQHLTRQLTYVKQTTRSSADTRTCFRDKDLQRRYSP